MSLLLLSEQDLETIEISQILTKLDTGEFLSSVGSSEFGFNISSSPALHHGLGAGSTRNFHNDAGQFGVTNEARHTGNLRTLDEDTVKIDDVKDDGDFTGEFSFLQQDNTSNFNKCFKSLEKKRENGLVLILKVHKGKNIRFSRRLSRLNPSITFFKNYKCNLNDKSGVF